MLGILRSYAIVDDFGESIGVEKAVAVMALGDAEPLGSGCPYVEPCGVVPISPVTVEDAGHAIVDTRGDLLMRYEGCSGAPESALCLSRAGSRWLVWELFAPTAATKGKLATLDTHPSRLVVFARIA